MNDIQTRSIINQCRQLLGAYENGELGNIQMPEDSNPGFGPDEFEERLAYFTLPMALNYQRNSYALWEAALKTWHDPETKLVFDIEASARMSPEELRSKLTKYKVALQPNKHIATWQRIAQTVADNWGSLGNLMGTANNSYLDLRDIVQGSHKKGFPYLSGPKIFNYWAFIIGTYGKVPLENRDSIEIAPDTHVLKASVLLGVITKDQAEKLSKTAVADIWRSLLLGSGIDPIDMHPPLWFWSKNNFEFQHWQ